jgi:hypothetical protein
VAEAIRGGAIVVRAGMLDSPADELPQRTGDFLMIRTAIRTLFATALPRTPRRPSPRLRPALMALEDRRLLSAIVVDNPSRQAIPGKLNLN